MLMEATTPPLPEPSLFEQGGSVMYVLLLAAIIGVTYIIYCMLVLRRSAVMSAPLVLVAENVSDESEFEDAIAVCKREGGAFAEIIASVIATRDLPREESEAIVEGAGRRAMHDLSRGTLALEVVSGTSTMLGLLGTVSGMFNMMMTISHAGVKDIGAISGGIGEALITTMFGLAIAIPAYVAYVYFSRRVEDMVLMMEEYAIHLMTRIRRDPLATPARSGEAPTAAAASVRTEEPRRTRTAVAPTTTASTTISATARQSTAAAASGRPVVTPESKPSPATPARREDGE